MNIQEMIDELQEYIKRGIPPETPVCVSNKEVYMTEVVEAYYDGELQKLIIDESQKPHYCIVGSKATGKGLKCRLTPMGVEDVIWENINAKFDFDDLNERNREFWLEKIEEWKKEIIQTDKQVEEDYKKYLEKQKNDNS